MSFEFPIVLFLIPAHPEPEFKKVVGDVVVLDLRSEHFYFWKLDTQPK